MLQYILRYYNVERARGKRDAFEEPGVNCETQHITRVVCHTYVELDTLYGETGFSCLVQEESAGAADFEHGAAFHPERR